MRFVLGMILFGLGCVQSVVAVLERVMPVHIAPVPLMCIKKSIIKKSICMDGQEQRLEEKRIEEKRDPVSDDDLLSMLPTALQAIVRSYCIEAMDFFPFGYRFETLVMPQLPIAESLAVRLRKPVEQYSDDAFCQDMQAFYKKKVTVFMRSAEGVAIGFSDGFARVVYPDDTIIDVDAESPVRSIAFDSHKTVVIGCENKTAIVRQQGGTEYILEGHRGAVTAVAIDNKYIATGSTDSAVRLWEWNDSLKRFQVKNIIWGHVAAISNICMNCAISLTTVAGNTAHVWSPLLEKIKELQTFPLRLLFGIKKLLAWLQEQQLASLAHSPQKHMVYASDLTPVIVGLNVEDEVEYEDTILQKPKGIITKLPPDHLQTFKALPVSVQKIICEFFGCPAPAVLIQNSKPLCSDSCCIQ